MTDFRLALRQLRRTPAFTLAAVLTLALGIGVSTAVFAVIDALVLRATSIARLDDVYHLSFADRRPADVRFKGLSIAAFDALQRHPPDPIVALSTSSQTQGIVQMPGRAERVVVEAAKGDYAAVLGLYAQAGRWINRDDDAGALPNVVVSDRIWREWFERRLDAVGHSTVRVDGTPMTIVGVAPRGFLPSVDVWLPDSTHRASESEFGLSIASSPFRTLIWGQVMARARPTAPRAAIEAAIAGALAGTAEAPDPTAVRIVARPWAGTASPFQNLGIVIVGLAVLVLVAACANLANMLYARGTKRTGEVAVRLALGASRARIFRLVAAESVAIAIVASAIGLAIAVAAIHASGSASESLLSARTTVGPRAVQIGPDWRIVLFALGAGAFAAVTVGLTTAWRASRVPALQAIGAAGVAGQSTARGRRMRQLFVAVQVTVAVILVMATGLFVRRAIETLDRRVLFDTSRVAAARIDLSLHDYMAVDRDRQMKRYNATRGRAFYQQVLDRVARIPGASHAALADGLPGHAYMSSGLFLLVPEQGNTGAPDAGRRIGGGYAGVSSAFIDALGLRLLRGRSIVPSDGADGPFVVVLGEGATTRLWPGVDPIGKRLMFGNDGRWRTVVGVVSDPVRASSDSDWSCASCVAFVPWEQMHKPQMLVMASGLDPAALVEPLRAAIRDVDPDVAILEAAPLDDSILGWTKPARAAMWLMTSLGLAALAISTLGVYGVVSYFVSQRTREFGIRAALGATPRRLLKSVLDDAVHLILVGLLPGVFLAAIGSRLAERQIARLMPNDIPTWFVVPLLILLVGVIAAWIPARRAARVEPTVALREL